MASSFFYFKELDCHADFAIAVSHHLGNRPQVPHDAQPGEEHEHEVSDIDLPPEETLSSGNRIVVVVVVPPFASVISARTGLLRLVSVVSYLRVPIMWSSELMVQVP